METDNALRNADNQVVTVLALVFAALVFVIGILSNDEPTGVPMVQSSFDVALPVVTVAAATTRADGEPQPANLAHLAHVATAGTDVPKDYTWYVDETAGGTRPDSQH